VALFHAGSETSEEKLSADRARRTLSIWSCERVSFQTS
jgi:hypothetical protein